MDDSAAFPGFAAHWHSLPDFVLGVTWDICEGRNLAAIRDHFAADAILRSPAGVLTGPAPLLAQMLGALAEFPDLELLSEDIIWCATPESTDQAAGYHASQRILARGRHLGQGRHGLPTGRATAARVMVDLWCAESRIRDLWLVEDSAARLAQLGLTPREQAERQIRALNGAAGGCRPLSPDTDIEGAYFGRGHPGAPGADLKDLLEELMAGGFSTIPDSYDRACELHYPGGETARGHAAAERFWLGLRAALPSAAFRVEHVTGIEEPGQPPRASLRWSLYGRHDGPGLFGPPTGGFLYVMGITQAEFGPRGLRREWTLIDDTAIWTQILLATG